MTTNAQSNLSCPNCGQVNHVTADNLPSGTPLHCSQCQIQIGRWEDRGEGRGFVAEAAEPPLHLDIGRYKADL